MNPQIIHSHFKTKLARAFVTSAVAILLGLNGLATHAQTVIWSDNFNIPDTGSLDGSDQTGRHTGLLANNVVGRSGGVQLTISGNALNLLKSGDGSGRMRFADPANTGGRTTRPAIGYHTRLELPQTRMSACVLTIVAQLPESYSKTTAPRRCSKTARAVPPRISMCRA